MASSRKRKQKVVQMAKPNKEDGWLEGDKVIPFAEMEDTQLQSALLKAERKELFYFNLCGKFSTLVGKILDEAERRGLEVDHIKKEFTKKNVDSRNKLKNESDNHN